MAPTYNPKKHHRRSIRLKGYDYTQPGEYFVTICTHNRNCLFGQVVNGQVELNEYGQIVAAEWEKSPMIRRELELDVFVIMPNHLHGIVNIVGAIGVGAIGQSPLHQSSTGANSYSPLSPGAAPKSLGAFIIGFKSAVTKQINQWRGTPGLPVWQRNYYEHIIRSNRALEAIRHYIEQNPRRWELDRYNPSATDRDPQAAMLWELLKG